MNFDVTIPSIQSPALNRAEVLCHAIRKSQRLFQYFSHTHTRTHSYIIRHTTHQIPHTHIRPHPATSSHSIAKHAHARQAYPFCVTYFTSPERFPVDECACTAIPAIDLWETNKTHTHSETSGKKCSKTLSMFLFDKSVWVDRFFRSRNTKK